MSKSAIIDSNISVPSKKGKESQKQKSVDEATGGGKDDQGAAVKLTKEEKKKLKAERRVNRRERERREREGDCGRRQGREQKE